MYKILLLIVALFVVAGCTMKGTYNRLDWMLTEYLESYVELDKSQKAALRQRMQATLEWHRRTQLPAYSLWLKSVKHDIRQGITQPQVEQHGLQLLVFWRAMMVRFSEDMAVLLPQLDAKQREELFTSLADKNAEYHVDYIQLSHEQQRKNYIKRMDDIFDGWLGSVTRQQEQRIIASADQIHYIAKDVLKTRMRWQLQLREILQNHKDTVTTQVALQKLFVEPETLRSDRYNQQLIHNAGIISHLITDVANQLTDKQQKHLFKRIDKYIKLFDELAEEAQPQQAARQCEAC